MDMQCILVEQIGSFRTTRRPVPRPGDGQVLIKVKVAGLCRTDLKLIRFGHRDLVLPRIPAEEVVGEVMLSGRGVQHFKPGDRVYVYPGVWCNDCPACRMGAENLCRAMRIMGFHRDGGFAEYVLADEMSLIRLPDGLAYEDAIFAEPLSCCLNTVELAGVKEGMSVGIWGAGPAGNLLGRLCTHLGASIYHIEPNPNRRDRVSGAVSAEGKMFDVCIVAVGEADAYRQALNCLGPRGCLAVFSGLLPEHDQMVVSLNQLHYHEQRIVGAYGCSHRHGKVAIDLIAQSSVLVQDLVSHDMSLWDLGRALDMVADRSGMKILLRPY